MTAATLGCVTAPTVPVAGVRDASGLNPAVGAGRAPEVTHRRRVPWRPLLGAVVVVVLAVESALVAPMLGGAFTSLLHARLPWVAAAVLAEAASMALFARTRRRLLAAAGTRVGVRDALAAVYVANALHVTMPGGAAFSTAYSYRWMRSRGAGPAAIAWTLTAGGVVATAALAGIGVVGSLLVGDGVGLLALAVDALAVAGLVAGLRLFTHRPDLVVAAGRRLLGWGNALLRRPPERGVEALERLVGQLRAVRPRTADWTAAGVFSVGNWLFDVLCFAAAATALGVPGLSPSLLLIAYTAGMAAGGLSFLPGGIGVVDTAMVLALVAGGVPAVIALPAVLLYRLISLVGVVAAGWVVAAVQSARGSVRPSTYPGAPMGGTAHNDHERSTRPRPAR